MKRDFLVDIFFLVHFLFNRTSASSGCPNLTPPEHGNLTQPIESRPGDVATYTCNETAGYHVHGLSDYKMCMPDLTWYPVSIGCVDKWCPTLAAPDLGGAVIQRLARPGDVATYKCPSATSGVMLITVAQRTCLSDFTWTGYDVNCTMKPAGDNCTAGDVCTDFATCVSGVCDCVFGFYFNGSHCVTESALHAGCITDDECGGSESVCRFNRCGCRHGYTSDQGACRRITEVIVEDAAPVAALVYVCKDCAVPCSSSLRTPASTFTILALALMNRFK